MPAIRRIVREAKANDYRLSSLILGVARSAAFQMASADPVDTNQSGAASSARGRK
jgi:uncharacterized protein DUF1585